MKNPIHEVLGEAYLTYEELCTILVRIEVCLNSRPLTEISHDPSDFNYLTPVNFLIGEYLLAVPERDERLERWRRVQHFSQMLWKRWDEEYRNQLQERRKWFVKKGSKIKVGAIV